MSTPGAVRIVAPLAGVDPGAVDGDGLIYDGTTGTWVRDPNTRVALADVQERVDALEAEAGGALKAYVQTARSGVTFGPCRTSGPWQVCPTAYRVTVPAAVGDVVQWLPNVMVDVSADSEHDLAAVVAGSPVRYASTGTATQHPNGMARMYLGSGAYARSWPVITWQVQSGDLDTDGNLTLAVMYRADAPGNTVGSAAYANSTVTALNWGQVTTSGGDLTGRVTALEDALGAAGGIATLDGTSHVPIGQLPLGTTSSTVAVGNDARLSDSRTPTAHATSHASGGSDPVTPAAIGALATTARGAAGGVASLDGSTLVPIAQLPLGTTSSTVTVGNDSRFTSIQARLDALEASGGGALKATGTTGLLDVTFGLMDTSGSWTLCPSEYRVTVAAAVGDVVQWLPELIIYRGSDSSHDLAAVVGGAPVRYASSGTGTQGPNGHASMYIGTSGTFASAWPVIVWHVQAGDLDTDGNLTLALMYRAGGSGNRVGSTTPGAYPNNIIDVLNWGPVVASGEDLTGRVIALEDALGAAGGIATLDGGSHVPIAQLPLGTTSSTVAVGNDARLSDSRTPTAHAASHASGGSDPVTPAAIGALGTAARGAANGVASLDGSTLVPVAQLPVGTSAGTVAAGNDSRMTNARTPTAHATSHASGGSDPVTPAAIGALATTARGAAGGVASLDGGTLVPVAQLPVGSTAGTVAAGDDSRLTNARTPTAHAASHASGGSDPVTPAAIGALGTAARGAANGVASLDGSTLVPVAQLPLGTTSSTVTVGNDARLSDSRTPTAHATSHGSGGSDPVTPAAIGALATTARGAASGVASLDGSTLVPIAQLPLGTTSSTVAVGNDARLSDSRTPTAHAASHASGGSDPVTPAAIGALATSARGIANGVAPLDSGLLVPVAYLPVGTGAGTVAAGNDSRFTDSRTPTAHATSHGSGGSDPVTPAAIGALATTARGAASGVASLDGSTLVPIAQLPLGTTSSTVTVGNDSRLSNSRTPTAHAASHASGGSDPVTPAAIIGGSPANGDALAYNGSAWVPSARLSTAESGITALGLQVAPHPSDLGMFGDAVSSVERARTTNSTSLSNGFYTLSMIVIPKSLSGITKVRFFISGAGVASSGTAVSLNIYTGSNPAALTRVATAPVTQASFTSTGVKELTLSATIALVAGERLAWMTYIPASGFTTSPGLGCTAVTYAPLINAGANFSAYKAAAVAAPTPLDTTSGWTTDSNIPWWSLL